MERAEIIWEKGTNRKRFYRGQVDKYSWVDIGSSYLPSDIIAAFLYAQLEMAEKIIETRRAYIAVYMQGLSDLETRGLIRLPAMNQTRATNGHIMYIITDSLKERSRLIEFLRQRGIISVFHYIPLHSSIMGSKCCRVAGEMSVTNEISDRLLRMPMYYEMRTTNVLRVVDAVQEFYNRG